MPYLILFVGLLIGLYAFMRYFTNAKVHDVKSIFAWMGTGMLVLALLFLAMTGRVIPAIVILVLLLPFALSHWKSRRDANVIDVEPIEDNDDTKKDDES